MNVPAGSSRFNITDEEVPFYAMVIHGYMNYAASPMNTSGDQDLLQTVTAQPGAWGSSIFSMDL
ncbi:DUF5696 domain-containing protein [Paenibacillus amylolyticus]|nr:DUF5696 domain-containing protein [Paenibacillus amylolyticus]